LQRAQDEYIDPIYLPEGVILKQFYHICEGPIKAILEQWTQEQDSGNIPLKFKKAIKDKRATKEADANVDAGGEGSEEDRRDDGRSQPEADGPAQANGDGGRDGSPTEQAHPGQSPGDAEENPNGVS
jgi:hypothetical protein